MGVRESMNKSRRLTGVMAGLLIVGAGVAIFVQARDMSSSSGPGKAYFTTDDGQTLFVDDALKLPPFDHDGKPAYRAHVFECGGKRVVGYLSRYTAASMAALKEAKSYAGTGKPPPNVGALAAIGTTGQEVKRPGAANKWVSQADATRATQVRVFRCSADGSTPSEVDP